MESRLVPADRRRLGCRRNALEPDGINGAHYYLQGAWSDQLGACALTSSVAPTFTPPSSAVSGSALSFTASPGTNASVASYAWTFGDGSSGDGQSVNHTYTAAGAYTVTLTVTDTFGNTGSVSEQVLVTAPAPTGKTAGATGSGGTRHSSVNCGSSHANGKGVSRECTRTTVAQSHRVTCKRAHSGKAASCHTVVQTVTRRAQCTELRRTASTSWSIRCGAAVTVSSRG